MLYVLTVADVTDFVTTSPGMISRYLQRARQHPLDSMES
jgi:hypothetical protein